MKKIRNELLNEEYYEIKHPSGLKIYVMPKKNYSTCYAAFAAKYGSVNASFRIGGKAVSVPDGTAHFLEHKLFESDEVNAFEKFSQTGADANAFTSFDRTCYLFSCSENVYENLGILLDFVQNPFFTEQTVRKEQGIIGQEIKMYDDNPGWVVTFNLLRALYHNHPINKDIAGSVQSIAEITADKLYEVYGAYYNLNNMVLSIVGNVYPDKVAEVCNRVLKPSAPFETENIYPVEPDDVVRSEISEEMAVSIPSFAIGYKEKISGTRTLEEKMRAVIITEAVAGGMSPLYQRLLKEGLVNSSFGCEYFNGYGYASVIFQGESKNPTAVKNALDDEIARVKKEGIDNELFNCIVKELYGDAVMAYNNIENIAQGIIESHFNNNGLFDEMDFYKNIKLGDVNAQLQNMMIKERSALSVIKPSEENNG